MSTFLLLDAVEPPKPKIKAAVHIEPPPNVYTEIVQEESNSEPELAQTPEWFILPGDGVSLNESAKVIFGHIGQTRTLFLRGNVFTEVVNGEKLRFELVENVRFSALLEEYGVKVGKRKTVGGSEYVQEVVCPVQSANQLLKTKQAKLLTPKISAIYNCGLLINRNNEPWTLGNGYHEECGGVFINQRKKIPDVPLTEAVDMLKRLFSDWDFQSENDYSRAIASVITPALKMGGHISGPVPMDVAEADKSQSGKTFRQKVTAAVYGEHPYIITQTSGGVGGVDESLSAGLMAGNPFLLFDNWRGKLDSPKLESFITADGEFPARIPYHGEVLLDSSKFFLMMSSNGAKLTPDLANRSNIVRIFKRADGYSFDKYPEGDVLDHVKANQVYCLGCVFSVVKAWISAGKPHTDESRHDMRQWVQISDWIVQTYFGAAPIMDGHNEAKSRTHSQHLSWLRDVAITVESEGLCGQEMSATDIVELCFRTGIEIPKADSNDVEKIRKMVGIVMKQIFDGTEELDCDGWTVMRRAGLGSRLDRPTETRRTTMYVFNRKSPSTPSSSPELSTKMIS